SLEERMRTAPEVPCARRPGSMGFGRNEALGAGPRSGGDTSPGVSPGMREAAGVSLAAACASFDWHGRFAVKRRPIRVPPQSAVIDWCECRTASCLYIARGPRLPRSSDSSACARRELGAHPPPAPARVRSATRPDGRFRMESLPPFGAGSMGGYWTAAEIKTKLDQLVANDAQDLVADKVDTVGYSREGRPIWGL